MRVFEEFCKWSFLLHMVLLLCLGFKNMLLIFFFVLQYIPLYIFALSNVNSEYKKKKKGYLQLELHRKEHNLHFY